MKRLFTTALATALCTLPSSALAMSVLGISIGETTTEQLQEKYKVIRGDGKSYTGGVCYTIPKRELNISGLNLGLACVDENDIVTMVALEFAKSRYDDLKGELDSKYKRYGGKEAFVGDKSAFYVEQDTGNEVWIKAPHMSFELVIRFLSKEAVKRHDATLKASKQAKEAETKSIFGD